MPRRLPLSLAALSRLAQSYGTPFHIYDEAGIVANARMLLASMRARFPEFQQYFAVKALPNPSILRVLLDCGCGLDCSSRAELTLAARLSVPGDKIMFTSNYTSEADLALARRLNCIINLDDCSLVPALERACESEGLPFPETVCFRINPGLGRSESPTDSNVLGGDKAKFGVPLSQVTAAYAAASAAGARRFGMHMMTGSCVTDMGYWSAATACLMDAAARVRSELGLSIDFINVGGGLGIPYRPDEPDVDVDELAAVFDRVVRGKCAEHGMPVPRLCMENGRFITGPFGWLVARCHAVKRTDTAVFYGLDASMSNLMRPGMYGAYHHITVPAREITAERARCNVVGTLCENNDFFAKDRELPASEIGDLFVIHDTGAHGHSMGFNYNCHLRSPELLARADGSVVMMCVAGNACAA